MSFRKAGNKKVAGKFLVSGDTGCGKSCFALTFPKIAAVDSENGMIHYEGKPIEIGGKTYDNLQMVDNTSDIATLEEDLEAILDGEMEGINTFAIDSETKFYNAMQIGAMTVEERRARKKGGDIDDATISQKQWGKIKMLNMKLQQAKIDLSAMGVHVVSIAQETEVKEKRGADMVVVGHKPDMHKSVKFDYDTILRMYKVEEKDGTERFFAKVLKDRTNVTKVGQVIENPTYDIWAAYFEGNDGKEALGSSYRAELDKTTNDMVEEDDKAAEIISEWKALLAKMKAADKTEETKKVTEKIKELKIDIKAMDQTPSDVLTQLLDFTRNVAA